MDNKRMLANRYQLISVLGHGGMADVYLAWDHILKRYATIKILRLDLQDDVQAQKRFQHEAATISELNSPYIVKVYDFGEENNLQYLVMEYVKGTNLKTYLRDNYPLSNQRVVSIIEQILKAVTAAHEKGIIHRDLKPQNILIDTKGNAKISDFGISITMSDQTITKTNYVLGSIHYLSPEQILGRRATKQSDIYSLGIIMFELLTDKVPFDGENAVSIALKHTSNDLPDIKKDNPKATQGLINIVRRATAKDPKYRYPSTTAMLYDVQHFALTNDVEPYVQPIKKNDGDETKVISIGDLKDNFTKKPNVTSEKRLDHLKSRHPLWRRKLSAILLVLFAIFMICYYVLTQTKVPNLNSLSYVNAVRKLDIHHIRVNGVQYKNNGMVPHDHVISAVPNSKSRVNRIWGVKLILSTGYGKVKLGNYIGQNITEVKKKLEGYGFKVTTTINNSSYFKNGQILKQNFTAGDKVDTHKTIQLTICGDQKQFVMKDLTGMTKDNANSYIQTMGLNPTFEYRNDRSVKNGTIIQQNPTAGLKVYAGDNIIVVIASNSGKSQDNNGHDLNVNVNLPYLDNNSGYNNIQIFLQDQDHSLGDMYKQLRIYQNSKVVLPFRTDSNDPDRYQVYRDGKKIMDVNNIQ